MHTDNPAGRLLNILLEGKKISSTSSGKIAWSHLLEIGENDLSLLMSRLGKVMELPEQVITQIKNYYPNQSNTHKHWSKKVNIAFSSQNINGAWSQFIDHIDSHTIDYLSMSVDLLDMKENTKIISEEKLTKMYESINDMLLEVIESDLEKDFKKYLVHYLRKLLITIQEYKISGAAPILEAIESTFGHAFIDGSYRNNIQTTGLGQKIVTVLSATASILTIAVGLPTLPETFQLLLSPPSK